MQGYTHIISNEIPKSEITEKNLPSTIFVIVTGEVSNNWSVLLRLSSAISLIVNIGTRNIKIIPKLLKKLDISALEVDKFPAAKNQPASSSENPRKIYPVGDVNYALNSLLNIAVITFFPLYLCCMLFNRCKL